MSDKKVHVTENDPPDATAEAAALAEEYLIPIAEITGSGKDGRVLIGDVQAEIDRRERIKESAAAMVTSADVSTPPVEEPGLTGDQPPPVTPPDGPDEGKEAEEAAAQDGEEGTRYAVQMVPGKLPYPGIACQYQGADGVTHSCRVTTRHAEYLTDTQIRAVAKTLVDRYSIDPDKLSDYLTVREVPAPLPEKPGPVSSGTVRPRP